MILNALEWIGRHATKAVAVSLILGTLLPGFSELVRPYFPIFVFLLLTSAFLRVDYQRFVLLIRQPRRFILPVFWILVGIPLIGGFLISVLFQPFPPGVTLAIIMMFAAPPVMSMVSFLAILRLDSALGLTLLLGTSFIVPFSAPLIVEFFAPEPFSIDGVTIGRNLLIFTICAALLAGLIRRLVTDQRISAAKTHIDGFNVILLFFFAIALMGNLGQGLLERPLLVLVLFVASFALAAIQIAITTFVFIRQGLIEAFSIGMSSGSRNMGLLIAVAASTMPEDAWLWFAVAQFPIYFMPLLAEPIARMIVKRH